MNFRQTTGETRRSSPGERRTGALVGSYTGFCALAIVILAASGARAQDASPRPAATAPPVQQITDEIGRRVSVPQPVRRIVSLAPSLTETLYALGAQERLAGVTDYCDYPPEARAKPKVGGAVNPNLEQVVALKPDLVLATRSINRRETVQALDRLGIAAYVTDPRSVEAVLASIGRLAEVIGAREESQALVAELRTRLAELKRQLGARQPRRVLFVVWAEPLISIGRETFLADALRWAGAESVVETSQDWPRLSLEEVVRLQPDYLVFASAHSQAEEQNFEAFRDRPGWRNLEAVRQRRIAVVSEAINRPAPRLVDAILELARQLHPEAFPEKPEARNSNGETGVPEKTATPEREECCQCAR